MQWLLNEYKGFSRKERRVLLTILWLLIILIFFRLWQSGRPPEPYILSEEQRAELDSFIKSFEKTKESEAYEKISRVSKAEKEEEYYFRDFNPNEVGKEELMEMGVKEYLAGNIISYRNAGGRFRNKTDLLRIYGMDEKIYQKMESYITIPPLEELRHNNAGESDVLETDSVSRNFVYINKLNSSSFKDLMQIEGMQAKIAGRILKYRDLLGGYYSFDQLKEVYGMTDSIRKELSREFLLDIENITSLSISQMSFSDILRHPYMEKEHVKKIFLLKEFYGDSLTIEHLKENKILPDSIIQRIGPYFSQ